MVVIDPYAVTAYSPGVRPFLLAFLGALLATSLTAGELPAIGPGTLLGDAALAPIGQSWTLSTALATDGDEVVLFWSGRSALYAQRLDRHGRLVTGLPVLLLGGTLADEVYVHSKPRVVYAGGIYTIFFDAAGRDRRVGAWSMRLTRELEVLDVRMLAPFDSVRDAARAGDEIILLTVRNLWRLRDDLSVIEKRPASAGLALAPSPSGTVVISGYAPAITARMVDDSASARVETVDEVNSLRAVWTGTRYLIVWTSCRWGCITSMVALDQELRPQGRPVLLAIEGCASCHLGITLLGHDDAFVTWQQSGGTRGVRVRNGTLDDPKPWVLGDHSTTLFTAQGLLFDVDSQLNVRAFVLDPLDRRPGALPVISTPRAAVEETIAAVARSATEVAVARRRGSANLVSILDHEGRTLREVPIAAGEDVALAHDGTRFYALVSTYGESRLQRVESGAAAVKLPFRAANALAWAGSGFVILQSNYPDPAGAPVPRTRMLWLTREGAVEVLPCPNWEFPTAAETVTVAEAGPYTVINVDGWSARVRDGCPTGPPVTMPDGSRTWRPAWQNGTWAWAAHPPGEATVDLAVGPDLGSPLSTHRVPEQWVFGGSFDIAPLSGRWLVAYNDGSLRAALADAHGRVVGRVMIAETPSRRPFLLPVSPGRVLAIYERPVREAPYLGVLRVMAAPVTLEAAVRRRMARP